MDLDSELSRCTHDPDLWYADGNVVLRADNTLFRVYIGILSQASPVFHGMFEFPQPAEDSESYDGCPLIYMPDSAQDLRPFLRAVFDCSQFNVPELEIKDIPAIASVLRISTKYEVQSLRKRAIDALLRWYPTSYKGYSPLSTSARPQSDHPRHVMVANVAREADALVLLPTALLACAATANSTLLWDGFVQGDARCALTESNKRALFIGRPKLAHVARNRTQAFFFYPHVQNWGCKNSKRCGEFCRIYADAFDHRDDPWMNPFYRINWKAVQSACCEPCATKWELHQSVECELAWDSLPSYFELPCWSELVKLTYGISDSDSDL